MSDTLLVLAIALPVIVGYLLAGYRNRQTAIESEYVEMYADGSDNRLPDNLF